MHAIGALAGGEHVDPYWYLFAVIAVAIVIDLSRVGISLRSAARYDSDLIGSLAVLGGMVLVDAGDAIATLALAAVIFTAADRLCTRTPGSSWTRRPRRPAPNCWRPSSPLPQAPTSSAMRVRESGGRYFADVVVGVPPTQRVRDEWV